ncbi:hypothetical protein UlMin_037175 [Ulmus minor]
MTWDEFIVEFNQKYYNRMAMRAQQNEFINIKQGSMSVTEAVRKFDQLARLCPYLVPTEEERVRRMLEMTNQYGNNNNKRKGNFGGQKNGKGSGSQNKKPNITYPTCKKCGKNHPGECRSGTNMEGPSITQSRLEAPETNARIFTFSRNDAEAGTSNVVTDQLSVAKMSAYVLFDSGATHSFISNSFAGRFNWVRDRMNQSFHIALPSGEVLLSNYWVRHVPIVFSGREHADLVLIKTYDYDVILGMDFLGKYNSLIECRRRRVIFHPYEEQKFEFVGDSRKQPKAVISSMRAKKLLASGCMGYLATVINKSVEAKGNVEDVPIVRDFVDVFPEELPGLPPDREIQFEIELLPGTAPISKAPY